ncbi:MAG: phosphohydrolase [Desulfuromonas sp.]|nr:MAG: phosphohydrolase [Desulfuromonas sp.]
MIELLEKFHPPETARHQVLIDHSRQVAAMAVVIARRVAAVRSIDIDFIEEAALLHDIGIHLTDTPEIGCYGDKPYLAHGYLGREILESEGMPRHALVCERHIGVGLSRIEIIKQDLPLPQRDMLPLTIEEKIVTYADLFFSKAASARGHQRTFAQVRAKIADHGDDKIATLDEWHYLFSG